MATSLFANERIETTVAKAKELRPFAERLITIAKRGAAALETAGDATPEQKDARAVALTQRRRLMALLGGKKFVVIGTEKRREEVNVVDKLLKDIGPRFMNRAGGYTRVVKLATTRLGDAAPKALIELLAASEQVKAKTEVAAAADNS
jgi:large subunit ribosomal protein L17